MSESLFYSNRPARKPAFLIANATDGVSGSEKHPLLLTESGR